MHHQFSLTVIRPNKAHATTIKLSKYTVYLLAGFIGLSVLILIAGAVIIADKVVVIREYSVLKANYDAQSTQLDALTLEIESLKSTVESLVDTQTAIQDIIPESKQRYINNNMRRKIRTYRNNFNQLLQAPSESSQLMRLTHQADAMNRYIQMLQKNYDVLAKQLTHYQDRFKHTPSIWPIHGYVRSRFGLRMHPILGRKMFHYGVDIPSWLGTPVRATADGIVLEAMFIKGLGLSVIIDHGYGYKTIYAHVSKFQVGRHDRVKKGQVIANVGATGLVTAPSLHYEVWLYRKRINPMPFLNLNLMAAVKSAW